MRAIFAGLMTCLVAGCATPLTSYKPTTDEPAMYDQGVGSVSWQTDEAVLTMYPTFKYESPSEIPVFTLLVQNRTNHNIDFDPQTIHAWFDNRECHVYTLEERIGEIRSAAKRKQIALAIAGGLAAAGAGYAASHSTTTYNSYGTATGYSSYGGFHQASFVSSGTIQTYDPLAGMFAGAAVGAATGVGIHQIGKAAGYEEQAAQGIFQHTTIQPGATVVGQVMLKPTSNESGTLRLDVPMDSRPFTFMFAKTTTNN